jgi:hypothetical protein
MVLSMAAIRFANRSFVKFFSRCFTALNLMPSIATALPSSRCRSRHRATKRQQTLRMAGISSGSA